MELISEYYRKQLEELHQNPQFGISSPMYADLINGIIKRFKPWEVLDYGAGKQCLKEHIEAEKYIAYDPAIPGICEIPKPADMVVCTDVLEHVELGHESGVLDDLQRVTKEVGFFAIHTGEAMHHLPDGRNAHLIQQPASWWMSKICRRFEPVAMEAGKHGFWVIVTPRDKHDH